MSALPKTSDRLIATLRSEPALDDLKKARLEKQLLAAVAAGPSLTSVPVPPPRRRVAVAVGGVVALAAAALLVIALGRDEAPRYAITSVGGASGASGGAVQAGTELSLAAGESAEVELFDLTVSVRERSHLRVEAVSLADVRLALSSGEARFAFHPRERGRQHVAISTPAARVEIVGTELTVRATEAGTDVEVHEGVVRVIPLGGEAMLVEAGHAVSVPVRVAAATGVPPDEAPEAAPSAGSGGAVAGVESGESAPAAGEEPAAVEAVVEVPTDAELIARGTALLDRDAFAEVERTVRPVALGGASRADRAAAWRLIGEARNARHDVAGALDAYEHEVDLSRGDDRANAIYERARLLERAGDTERARTELARYLAEHPDGPNAATARARLEALGGAPTP